MIDTKDTTDGSAHWLDARGRMLEAISEARATADRLAATGTPDAKREAQRERAWATKSETLILYFDDAKDGHLPEWEPWRERRRTERPRRTPTPVNAMEEAS